MRIGVFGVLSAFICCFFSPFLTEGNSFRGFMFDACKLCCLWWPVLTTTAMCL